MKSLVARSQRCSLEEKPTKVVACCCYCYLLCIWVPATISRCAVSLQLCQNAHDIRRQRYLACFLDLLSPTVDTTVDVIVR